MNDKLVQDIMVPLAEYPCVCVSHTLRQAIAAMVASQIVRGQQASLPRVALVFDEDRHDLLGMLRRRDIMRGLEPRFLVGGSLDYRRKLFDVAIDPNLSELSFDKLAARIGKRAERPVGQHMAPIRATIQHDDHIMKAIGEMVDRDTSILPVLRSDTVVGVIRSVDVFDEIARILSA
jgi:CBS domain-containing protein